MATKSDENMSGCWSYLVDIYCFTALESSRGCDLRKGIYQNS